MTFWSHARNPSSSIQMLPSETLPSRRSKKSRYLKFPKAATDTFFLSSNDNQNPRAEGNQESMNQEFFGPIKLLPPSSFLPAFLRDILLVRRVLGVIEIWASTDKQTIKTAKQ